MAAPVEPFPEPVAAPFDMDQEEAPPSADPVQPRQRPVAQTSRLPRVDDAPSDVGSVPDDESLDDIQERMANRVDLGVTAPILRTTMSLPVVPAYEDDDVVEYYAVKQEQWILARMQVDLQRPSLQSVPSGNIHYNVLIGQVSKQLRQDVPLDVLRPPLMQGEPVEVFSLRAGGSWLPAIIDREQPGDTNLGYNIRLHPGGQELRRIPATRLRRRFPAKQVIRIYKGPDLGWTRMIVHPLAGKDGSEVRGLRIAEATPHLQSKSTPAEAWALVPVCREMDIPEEDSGSEDEFDPTKIPEPDWLPSYLVKMTNIYDVPPQTGSPHSPSSPRARGSQGSGWCSTDAKPRTSQEAGGACTPTSPTSPAATGVGSFLTCAAPEAATARAEKNKRAAAKADSSNSLLCGSGEATASSSAGVAKLCSDDTAASKASSKSGRKRSPPQSKEGDRGAMSPREGPAKA